MNVFYFLYILYIKRRYVVLPLLIPWLPLVLLGFTLTGRVSRIGLFVLPLLIPWLLLVLLGFTLIGRASRIGLFVLPLLILWFPIVLGRV